jgi:hexosaminidase
MSWRGEEGGIAAAKEKHNVIMTPGKWVYLDYAQDTATTEPLSVGGYTSVSKVYNYEPVPQQLSEAEKKYIVGSQCNVWTEYMKTPEHVEYMVYPRAAAMSEVLWTPAGQKDYDDFIRRMKKHLHRLKSLNVNYAKHIEKEFR